MLFESQPDFVIVYEQSDALLAVEELPEQLVDLILVDYRLSPIDGIETASRVIWSFENSNQDAPPMILACAFSNDELLLRAESAGIRQVITVADGPNALLDAVRAALA